MGKNSFHKVFHQLRCIHRHRIYEEFTKIGLTEGQPKIIGYLNRHDGCIQRELAENCHVKASTVTNLLMNMEKAGLIKRTSSSKDRRILNVYLTEKGKTAAEKIEKVNCSVDEQVFIGFSEEEKMLTINLLERICRNLENRRDDSNSDSNH